MNLGMPRSGKTTFLKSLKQTEQFEIIFEDFEQVPYCDPSSHEYNLWYANYVISLYKNLDPSKLIVIERGVYDRIEMAKSLRKCGYINDAQLSEHLNLLAPYKGHTQTLLLFNVPPEASVKNIKSNKVHFTRSITLRRI